MLNKLHEIDVSEDNLGIIFGIHFAANIETINGRTYQKDTWIKVLNEVYDENNFWSIPRGTIIGQIGHKTGRPGPKETEEQYNISHRVAAMWMEGDIGYAISIVGNTPHGNLLKAYYDMGIPMYPSTRGILNVERKMVTPENYTFFTIDYVFKPSLPISKTVFIPMDKIKDFDYNNYIKGE